MELKIENERWCTVSNINLKIFNCIVYPDNNGVIIKNLEKDVLYFFDELKQDLVNKVHLLGFQKTKICLEEFYCNPIKNNGDYLKINKSDVPFDSIIDVHITVSGIWFSDKSWGPYLIARSIKESEPLFIEDSDSEIDY